MKGCEEMAERLSAWLDGELEEEEVPSLLEHLRACPDCRALKERFEAVDRLATRSCIQFGSGLRERIENALQRKKPRFTLPRVLSTAASVLIFIVLFLAILFPRNREADAKLVTERVGALETMNNQALKEQETVLKTLEWELKAMKLLIGCSDLNGEKELSLLNRIDGLLNAIHRVRIEEEPKIE